MAIPNIKQGSFLTDSDLVGCWIDPQQRFYTPYTVWYEIGIVNEECDKVVPVCGGPKVPHEIRTGVLRPNFIVGDKWPTGLYRISWYFKDTAESILETRTQDFIVVTAGIYDQAVTKDCFFDLPASLQILIP